MQLIQLCTYCIRKKVELSSTFLRTFPILFALSCLLLPIKSFAETASKGTTEYKRIVSVGGTITEILYALDLQNAIVGVDLTSYYPAETAEKTNVGYLRNLNAEGILSLQPDLILALEESGPAPTIVQLKNSTVEFKQIPMAQSIEEAAGLIRQVAQIVGKADAGEELAQKMLADVNTAQKMLKDTHTKTKTMFLYARGTKVLMVAGPDTPASQMIQLAGGENANSGIQGFRTFSAEAVVETAPEVILMLTKGIESLGGVDGALKLPGVIATPAGKDKRIVHMDDQYLIGFGPRLGLALQDLILLLHPELAK